MLQTAIKREARMSEQSVLWVQTEVRDSGLMGQGSATPMAPERGSRAITTTDTAAEIERIMDELKRKLIELAAVAKPARTEGPTADAFADWYAELPDAMTVREFARRFSFDEKTVRNMIEAGELGRHRRKGCSMRVLKPQVREWVDANLGWSGSPGGRNGTAAGPPKAPALKSKARELKRQAKSPARQRRCRS